MTAPTPVTIVRPNGSVYDFVFAVALLFFRSWLIMLLLPFVTGFAPGYWAVLAGLWIAQKVFSNDGWAFWTRPKNP